MKIINVIRLLFIVLSLASCTKVSVDEMDGAQRALYSKIYMPRAERPVETVAISTTGDEKTFLFNAYLGGPVDAQEDIPVIFAVELAKVEEFNNANGTNYQLMPESGYVIESLNSVIKAGTRSTGDLKVTIKPGSHFSMFATYVLPISLIQATDKIGINTKLATTYLVFTVTYLPGQVPREKVLQLGTNWGSILSAGARGCLIKKDNRNDILVYEPDSEGKYTSPPRVVGVNWDAAESFYYVNESSIVVRNFPYWAGLFSFIVNANHDLPQANPFWLGDFWDKYTLVPFKGYFLTVDDGGIMRRQPVLSDINAPKTQVGTGFKIFKQIVAYKNSLLALEPNGKMWLYSMSDEGVPGARRQVGEGWDIYLKIIVSGDDILALDDHGDVYRYEFNQNGFYPLK